VGLDLSLSSAGIGIVTEGHRGAKLATDTIKSVPIKTGPRDAKGKPTMSLVDRYHRMRDHAAAIVHHAALADLVVIEGLTGQMGVGGQDKVALWWIITGAMMRRDIPVAVAAPAAMKRVIAGKGGADKVEVALALAKLWPEVNLGGNDSADAGGLAHCGAVALDMSVTTLERHRTMVWTVFPDITSAGAEVA
jgi:crossover junction endodeoxyribonuclease RuvC